MGYQLLTMNPQPPQLHSIKKLHKEVYPVVLYVTAPANKVSRILIEKIREAIKNSYELI